MIKKTKNKWEVLNKDGTKILGIHTDKKDAIQQIIAIEISKKKRKWGDKKKIKTV